MRSYNLMLVSFSQEVDQDWDYGVSSFYTNIYTNYNVTYLVSKSIVELHGGKVSVYSAGEGTGCTFTMDIPIISCGGTPQDLLSSESQLMQTGLSIRHGSMHRPAVLRRASTWVASKSSGDFSYDIHFPVDTSSMNVLIVDDAALNRKMLSRLIRPRFLQVMEAGDGLHAVDFVRQRITLGESSPPDVILMDFVMPNMDGPTATKEIRALGYSGIIIGVTGNALPADIEYFISNGANKVLTKPLRVEHLFAAIAQAV